MASLRATVRWGLVGVAAAVLAACATLGAPAMPSADAATFEQDRKAILAMAGDYHVTFDFRETVALAPGYELKKPKVSGAEEIVRVVEDRGDFISLQQILVMKMGDDTYVTKHWRQDWQYQPESVLVFIGGNAWETRPVSAAERKGKWAQTVYQVEDSPRYGAVGAWTHDNGVSQWTPPAEMRPLPRRDMTTRDDYDAVLAVNRHTITPFGWVQEEENSKLVLRGDHHVLVREIGVNSYKRADQPREGRRCLLERHQGFLVADPRRLDTDREVVAAVWTDHPGRAGRPVHSDPRPRRSDQ